MFLDKAVHTLIKRLKEERFIVQKYKSRSTRSVYLKIDFGLCHSIRISDHLFADMDGRIKYHVVENLPKKEKRMLQQVNEEYKVENLFFPMKEEYIEEIVQKIVENRERERRHKGKEGYVDWMYNRYCLMKDDAKNGFWKKSKII
jgi:hypothetical protein